MMETEKPKEPTREMMTKTGYTLGIEEFYQKANY